MHENNCNDPIHWQNTNYGVNDDEDESDYENDHNCDHANDSNNCNDAQIRINNGNDDSTTSSSSDGSNPQSTVGSTMSIMGSAANKGDYSSVYDETRWMAMKKRMMHDVEEVLMEDEEEEEGEDEREYGDEEEFNNQEEDILCKNGFDCIHENMKKKPNSELHNALLNDALLLLGDTKMKGECPMNISLECQIDSDTSFMDDLPLKNHHAEVVLENSKECQHSHSLNRVVVAYFSKVMNENDLDHPSNGTPCKKIDNTQESASTLDGESPF